MIVLKYSIRIEISEAALLKLIHVLSAWNILLLYLMIVHSILKLLACILIIRIIDAIVVGAIDDDATAIVDDIAAIVISSSGLDITVIGILDIVVINSRGSTCTIR